MELLYAKQLTQSDAACSKQIKLPKNEARKFAGDLKHRQSITLDVEDTKGRAWAFLCTCYGCQYALSRVGAFAKEYNLKAGDILVFLQNADSKLIVTVNEHVPSHLSVPVPRAQKAPHRRKPFTTRPPSMRSSTPDGSSVSSMPEADQHAQSVSLRTPSPRIANKARLNFDDHIQVYASEASPRHPLHKATFAYNQPSDIRPSSQVCYQEVSYQHADNTLPPTSFPNPLSANRQLPLKRPLDSINNVADEPRFRSPNLMHLIKKVCKDEFHVKQEEAAERSSGASGVSVGTASGASTGMRVMLPADDDASAPETTSRCFQQQRQQPSSALTWHPMYRLPAPHKGAPTSSHPLFQPPAARVNVLATGSLPVLLMKRLTKMDVACAHDQVGIVLPKEDVSASGMLMGLDEDVAMNFVVGDAMADGGDMAMPCALTPSGNRRFWYLTGLGPFLKRYQANHGQVLELSRCPGGTLMAYLGDEHQEVN